MKYCFAHPDFWHHPAKGLRWVLKHQDWQVDDHAGPLDILTRTEQYRNIASDINNMVVVLLYFNVFESMTFILFYVLHSCTTFISNMQSPEDTHLFIYEISQS